MNHDEKITYFASTDSRGKKVKFGIKAKDRTRHIYVIGKTGMGKSVLLENMAIQDIQNGEGFTFIDPHGQTAETLLDYIPEERIKDVLYFAPFDLEHPISFNVMENVEKDKRHLVANGLMSVFEKIWEDAWSARMAYILNNTILALLEYPDATLLGINRVMSDKDYRKKVVDNIQDPSVKSFWTNEYAKYNDRFAVEATAAIQNKVGQFTSNSLIRNIIGQPKSAFDLREMMDTRKIFIANLSKGRVGEGNVNLLGSMLITKIYLAAMSRADMSPATKENLPNFYLYVDEFQSFANKSFADILSEARKYKLNLTIAHQYIEQMSEEVRAAVFGNAGTMIAFRVGAFDAEVLEKEFAPTFTAEDLVNLGFIQIYLKLMIDGVSSQPFSATSLPPIEPIHSSFKEKIITFSREYYGKPRSFVEEKIKQWHEPVIKFVPKPKALSNQTSAVANKFQIPEKKNLNLPSSARQKTRQIHNDNLFAQKFQPSRQISQTYKSQAPTERIEKINPDPLKTISLNDLKTSKPSVVLKTQKEPSKENREQLRNALASVMKENAQKKQKTDIKEEIKIPQSQAQSFENAKEELKKEIPEETLRKMLNVDEKDK